jgi:hypothetical protein
MTKKQLSAQIERLERRRRALLRRLLGVRALARGSLTRVLSRCGKASCHCARQPSHVAWRLVTSRGGVQRCQLVRQDDVDRIQALVGSSKAFAQDLRALDAIQKEQKALLRGFREENDLGYE